MEKSVLLPEILNENIFQNRERLSLHDHHRNETNRDRI